MPCAALNQPFLLTYRTGTTAADESSISSKSHLELANKERQTANQKKKRKKRPKPAGARMLVLNYIVPSFFFGFFHFLFKERNDSGKLNE